MYKLYQNDIKKIIKISQNTNRNGKKPSNESETH